jgi:cytochrome c biogenesis protein CcmG/thiol:disulfide interchange protein DsbE
MFWLRIFPIALFALIALFFFQGLSKDSKKIPSLLIGKPVPHFVLPTLHSSSAISSETLKGRPYLLNVFASWCEACQTEHALLLQIAKEKGISMYGIDYKDRPETAKQFLEELGNPYQAVFLDRTGRVALDLGVYSTPETFLIDAQGIVRYRWVGPLTQGVWEKEVHSKIRQFYLQKNIPVAIM